MMGVLVGIFVLLFIVVCFYKKILNLLSLIFLICKMGMILGHNLSCEI